MSVKERLLAIKLMNQVKERPEYIEEIGVTIEIKKNNKNREIIEQKK